MDLQAHMDLEALHEPLHRKRAQRCRDSKCSEGKFSFESHFQISG